MTNPATIDIQVGERYQPAPFKFRAGLTEVQQALCVDWAKQNLFWLVEPRVDTEGIDAALDNPIADSIDSKYFSHNVRGWLQMLPLKFLAHWMELDKGFGTINGTVLSANWPANYKETMTKRAHEAQARLLGVVDEGNVRRVNFRRAG